MARSKIYLLVMMIWTILSLLKDGNLLDTKQNKQMNNYMAPILLVEATWYSEICHAGPRYKVKVDPLTGNVVPVYPEGYVYTPYIITDATDKGASGGEFDSDDIGSLDSPLSGRNGVSTEDPKEKDGWFRRKLRNKRLWRDFDEDSEMDAIVVSESESRRTLLHDTYGLEEGEFFVKPCLCGNTRWTFAPGAGFNEETARSMDGETYDDDFDAKLPYITPKNAPNSYGLYTNNELVYVIDNNQDGDLYLCREQAMYCGVLEDAEGIYEPIVKCYDQNMKNIIARNAWPLILLWYGGLVVICCCTVHGRTAGDFAIAHISNAVKRALCCCQNVRGFNDRMIDRMIQDDDRERRRRSGELRDDEDESRPWYLLRHRLMFERALMAQVQWIWRHQEYMREVNLREQGLPPPQIRLKVKRFRMETSTSNSKEGGFSKTPQLPPTSITTQNSIKDNSIDTSKHQQTLSALSPIKSTNASSSKTFPSEEQRGVSGVSTAETSVTDKSTSDGSTCSSSSAENVLVNKETACCSLCPDENNNSNNENENDHDSESVAKNEEQAEHNYASEVDSLDAPTCTICFCEFREGDRIGDLSCKHEFHIECLKGWVQRKNACPLCNVQIERPERPPPPPQDETDVDTESRTSIGEEDQNWMQRFNDWLHGTEDNANNDSRAGEISTGYRIGMIGVASTAADIAEARERVSRRNGQNSE